MTQCLSRSRTPHARTRRCLAGSDRARRYIRYRLGLHASNVPKATSMPGRCDPQHGMMLPPASSALLA